MKNIKVLSVGGSIVAPDKVDTVFIKKFKQAILDYLNEDLDRKLVFVVGGGGPARSYQKAYRAIVEEPDTDSQDWIGIMATRLNGELLKGVFADECPDPVVTNPTEIKSFKGRVLVAAGWKPGFSTDNDSVLLAENIGAKQIINLSNISKIYSADPKLDPGAVPLDNISWADMRKLVGDKWIPGVNVPFDPIATKRASELNLKVITASGNNIENMKRILVGSKFEGTTIGPE
ncbi:MAG: UMP kinase [Spirochaetia bacterium]|jgi:uridylate kinase|nr:UMP kinase [Spirochaetia bacterium]